MVIKKLTVAISSIGSGIGQGIITALRLSSDQYYTIGFGNNPFDFGAMECDHHEIVPSISSESYIDSLIEKCLKHNVKILIPGLDADVLALSENTARFKEAGITLLVSDFSLVSICRKKELIVRELREITDHFVLTVPKKELADVLAQGIISFPCIAKPRGGSGSIGVRLIKDQKEADLLPDDYIFQELVYPSKQDSNYEEFITQVESGKLPQLSELSVQYLVGQRGEFLGRIATINKLKNGVPMEIFPINRPEIWEAVEPIIPQLIGLGLKGPINFQGRITDEGIKFFEINPRFTGLTGLRTLMGFNEVDLCVKNWLGISQQQESFAGVTSKFGLRQVLDKSIEINGHQAGKEYYRNLSGHQVELAKTILITGASGYLGRNLIAALDQEKYTVWIITSDKEKAMHLLGDKCEIYFDREDIDQGNVPWGRVDLLLHAGFARPYRSQGEIADSLAFTGDIFSRAGMHEVPAIINISSQSVYGQVSAPPWKEDAPISPDSPYAIAKYATELMLKNEKRLRQHISVTSIRMAGITGGQPGLVPVDLVTRFVQQALRGDPLEILGRHHFERLDIRDAVEGIIHFLSIPPSSWQEVYNLGQGSSFSIGELAQIVVSQVSLRMGTDPVEISENIVDEELNFGMDSSAFFKATGWKPKYTLSDTIGSLISYLMENEGNN